MVWFTGSGVVHLGDQFFNGMFPFVDLSSGGSVQGLERSIAAVIRELPADCKVIPGHGPLTDMDGLRRYHRMLVTSIETVRAALAAGTAVADVGGVGLPEEWATWSTTFVPTAKWLETIAESLARDAAAPPDAGGDAPR
jgi:cyclase